MAKETKYSVQNLKKDFPTDEKCAEYLFDNLHTRECSCGGKYVQMKNRRQFQCSKCRFQIAPTSGTIFHKSPTPLTLWFHAIFIFSNAKSGISAKELERQLGVTYKTAWRMLTLIRKALPQDINRLSGDVEMDSAYFGGKKNAGENNVNLGDVIKTKSIVMGAVERNGKMRVKIVPDSTADTHYSFIQNNIEKEQTRLMTDKSNRYKNSAFGYNRHAVDHHRKEFVRGDVHINNIEAFWAHLKRSIKGTHKVISKKHLQEYLDGFVFHYNNRHNDKERFEILLGKILSCAG